MKKYLLLMFVFFAFLLYPSDCIHAEDVQSFQDRIDIQKDGTFSVVETLEYNFGDLAKHGIYREVPYEKTNSDGKRFEMTISNIAVLDRNGLAYPYTTSKKNSKLELKIGDPNRTISGFMQYRIGYTVAGGLTYFSDHDELYWQATGTDWQVPIKETTVVVALPIPATPDAVHVTCYTGSSASSASDCAYRFENDAVFVKTTRELVPGEGFTIVVGFPKGTTAVLEPKPVQTWFSDLISLLIGIAVTIGALFWYILFPIYIVVRWFQVGRDPKPPMGVASAWFAVPKTDKEKRLLTPGETGTLIDERAGFPEITATIVDLARRGYLKILETKKNDFTLTKTDPGIKGPILRPFEKELYDGIFKSGELVRIKDLDLITTVSETKKKLYAAVVSEGYFAENPDTVRTIYSVVGGVALCTFNFPLTLAAFIFGRNLPRKTLAGAQAAAVAQSLRNFITKESRQFAFQAKKQLFFEQFLPFAIAFGVERIWAERFKDIQLTNPDWYEGTSMRTFNSVYFVQSLQSSMHGVVQAATPTSSSSGFSSGFSGGSVGGGGGGGGGGSW